MKNMNYKIVTCSPEAVRFLFDAISAKDPGELITELHSRDEPEPWALSLYHSLNGAVPYLAGVVRDFETVNLTAKMVAHEFLYSPQSAEQLDWGATNSIFFVAKSNMVNPPPIAELRWLAVGLDNCRPPLPVEERGKTYVVLLDSTQLCENPAIQEVLALLRGERIDVTTEFGMAIRAVLEARND